MITKKTGGSGQETAENRPRDNARPVVVAWGSGAALTTVWGPGRSPGGNRRGAHVRASRARRRAMGSPRSGRVGSGA